MGSSRDVRCRGAPQSSEVVLHIFCSVPEKNKTVAVFRQVFPSPAGVLDAVDESLGVGHQSHDPAGFTAYASNGIDRAVGIEGEFHGGRRICWIGINEHGKIAFLDPLQRFRAIHDKFTFPVPDGR